MKKLTILLAVLLGISVMFNIMTIPRIKDRRPEMSPKDHSESPAKQEPISSKPNDDSDLSLILLELRNLKREVAALRKLGPPINEPTYDKPGGDEELAETTTYSTHHIAADPETAKLFLAQGEVKDFLSELKTLYAVRNSLGEEKHRQKALDATTTFLEMDAGTARGFQSEAFRMIDELKRLEQTQKDAWKNLHESPDSYSHERFRDISSRYKKEKEAALKGVQGYLNSSPRHERFKAHMDSWLGNLGVRSSHSYYMEWAD